MQLMSSKEQQAPCVASAQHQCLLLLPSQHSCTELAPAALMVCPTAGCMGHGCAPLEQRAWMPGVLRMCSGLLARAMPPCTASSQVSACVWAAGPAVQAGWMHTPRAVGTEAGSC